jgi:deoxycytidylate deaminase
MRPCLKQLTRCVIVRDDGRRYEATNQCNVDGLSVCPRVTAGCVTGTGYELCGSTHAEANAAELAKDSAGVAGTAYLYGHTWFCKECQDALTAVNVRSLVITGAPA